MTTPTQSHSIVFTAPHKAECLPSPLLPLADHVLVQSIYSAISTGTELLVYTAQLPPDIPLDSAFATQSHALKYPVKYGYCIVGTVVSDPTSTYTNNDTVFAFREHTDFFYSPPDTLMLVPENINPIDAVFLPFIETALSLLFDANLLPADKLCIVGQGSIGLITAAAARHLHPYSFVHTLDIDPKRCQQSLEHAKVHQSTVPTNASIAAIKADVSIDVSSSSSGLSTAIDATADHGTVIIGSWYGSKQVTLPNLGGPFHRSHIHLIASQVSHIPPPLTPRWSKPRRFDLAWRLIRDIQPSTLFCLSYTPLAQAPAIYKQLSQNSQHSQVIITYP